MADKATDAYHASILAALAERVVAFERASNAHDVAAAHSRVRHAVIVAESNGVDPKAVADIVGSIVDGDAPSAVAGGDPEPVTPDVSSLRVPELRDRLEALGLDTSGNKEALVERLAEATSGDAPADDGESDADREARVTAATQKANDAARTAAEKAQAARDAGVGAGQVISTSDAPASMGGTGDDDDTESTLA